jgi:hypothetical protein
LFCPIGISLKLGLERGLYIGHFSILILSFEVSDDINGIFMEGGGKNGGFCDGRTNI